MKLLRGFLAYIPYFLVIAIFAGSLGLSVRSLYRNQETLAQGSGDLHWTASQLQREYLRFLNNFDRYALGFDGDGKAELDQRLESLAAKLTLFLEGPLAKRFARMPETSANVALLREKLDGLIPEIRLFQKGDAAQYQSLRKDLEAFRRPVQQILTETFLAQRSAIDSQDEVLRSAYYFLGISLLGIFLSGSLLILFSVRQVRIAKDAEAQAVRAREQAEMANSAKSEFLSKISHELRTPLNAIIGFAEIMRGELFGALGNDKYRRYMVDIHGSGVHLLDLINDMLDLSKIEAGKYELQEEVVDLHDAVQSSLRIVRKQAAIAQVTLNAQMPDDFPNLKAETRAIKQILLNLLSNAIKFTPEGGTVAVKGRLADGTISLAVEDSGIGIEKHNIEKVLSPFGQTGHPMTAQDSGTGLGLPIVKSLTELHGGEFTLASMPGVVTTVTLSFPPERTVQIAPVGTTELNGPSARPDQVESI